MAFDPDADDVALGLRGTGSSSRPHSQLGSPTERRHVAFGNDLSGRDDQQGAHGAAAGGVPMPLLPGADGADGAAPQAADAADLGDDEMDDPTITDEELGLVSGWRQLGRNGHALSCNR